MAKTEGYLNWQIDISAYRLFGEELITDRVTAVFELVKNCYDANAKDVYVEFYNVSKITDESKIIIHDNGTGMNLEDIQNKWMIIGSNNKRSKEITDKPYRRKVIGEKGIGRFAVSKLGSKLLLKTKIKNEEKKICLEIDWGYYAKSDKINVKEKKNINKDYFTDIKNRYYFEEDNKNTHGTELIISQLNDIWSDYDINRIYKELSKIALPFTKLKPPFNIKVYSNEFSQFNYQTVKSEAPDYATIYRKITFDAENKQQEQLFFNEEKGILDIVKTNIQSFGPIVITLYYYNQSAKKAFDKFFGGNLQRDGIKIYRDGIITTPFAEYEKDQNKQRDILGIDKRRYSGFFDKINSHDMIGYIEITKKDNPQIKEATNRQDFVDNSEYRSLKEFIIHQIMQIENFLIYIKKKKEKKDGKGLKKAKSDVDYIIEEINKLKKVNPELKLILGNLESKTKEVKKRIESGIKLTNAKEKELNQQKELFFSLVTLQEFAADLSHIIKTALGKVLRYTQFFKDKFPDNKYNDRFKEYSTAIHSESIKLDKAVNFMLSYAKSKIGFEIINMKELLEHLFKVEHAYKIEEENINLILEINDGILIKHNRKYIEDIFTNLFSNSVKAMRNTKNKKIKCTSIVNQNEFVIYFSDNGCGIPEDNKIKIFDVFFTTTAEEGGAGIGLYSVKQRLKALKGRIEVMENEFKPTGATFMILIPFKQRIKE